MKQKKNLNLPRIIGHRGVKNLAPENTIESILKKYNYNLIKNFSHWQYLELGYITKRAKKYFRLFSLLEKIIYFLKLSSLPVPYYAGQTTFIFQN